MSSAGLDRLAAMVLRERARRRQEQDEFAADLGMSVRTLGSIERAERVNYSKRTVSAIEIALSWQPGSFERVIGGGRPRTSDRDLAAILAVWPDLPSDARAMLARVAQDAARKL